ncbi:hypothetical protein VD0002_g3984 [Verticillium dahliae]|uniref:Uncharacterized protein n=2 Tax=Verticillium dahliae TaxID=27337 RepID=G2X126_VERDV|nr:uncharacterized protein VDAG_03955 [Verticillium dahliae VdLs.17]EGY22517.1 hypothetical protein VDAG_03955 [Verticillium dahliae VdLs.17]KAH6704942.1 hypothetical protein EV126DRAFT_450113 [Verticillium dahliae]PNH56587.1 hypothetical protein VD0003_g1124 [Verticillium dahliae]PNH64825.1 hypothetical protein VD0002_g3984 [Verticillium dahliae]
MSSTATIYLLYITPPHNLSIRTLPLPPPPAATRATFLAALAEETHLPLTDRNVTLYWTLPHGAVRIAGGPSHTTTLLPTTIPVMTPVTVPYATWALSPQALVTPWTVVSPHSSGYYYHYCHDYLGATVQSSLVARPAVGFGTAYAAARVAAAVPATTYRAEPSRLEVSAVVHVVELRHVSEEQWPGYMSFGGGGLRLCVLVDVEGARARSPVVALRQDHDLPDRGGDQAPQETAADAEQV